ncbi:MAG: tetratricopeptide repeat protein [Kofleriaceae bacterium]
MKLDHEEPTTGIDPLRELGKQLPWDRPDVARREGVRSSLLVAASDAPPHRSNRAVLVGAGFVAGALAAAAVALVLVSASSSSPSAPIASTPAHQHYAQIESSSVAELEHSSAPTPSGIDEVVRVRGGTVRLAVPAIRVGDRVRTKTGDAEVEGSGAYEVVVANDKLTSVRVSAGTAKIIVDGQTIVLASGEAWTAPIITADLSPAPAVVAAADIAATPTNIEPLTRTTPAPTPQRDIQSSPSATSSGAVASSSSATRPTSRRDNVPTREPTSSNASASTAAETPASTLPLAPASSPPVPTSRPSITTSAPAPSIAPAPSSTEQHFQAGWALLRDGKYKAAAAELAIAASGTEPLASDARYFQAIALTKAGDVKEAEAALVAFLNQAPTSTRRGRAAVMLGRLIAARGDGKSARAWFTSALGDPDASVAGAAKAELAKL